MTAIRWLGRVLLALVVLALLALAVDAATFDREAAKRDYGRLKQAMAQSHANLDWLVSHRDLDLVALDRRTSEQLDGAFGRIQAYRAIAQFIDAFGDPHLHLAWGEAPEAIRVGSRSSLDSAASERCENAGYEAEELSGDLEFASQPKWRPLDGQYFPAGMIGDTAVLRIAEFGENKYRAACAQAAADGQDARELQLATRKILQDSLRETIVALKQRGARRLLVDLTGNGGGSEWATEAAALFASGTLSRYLPSMPDPQCDRTPIWRGEAVCPIYDPPTECETRAGDGVWTGPLYLLVDAGSASATEEFATWLHGSDKALLVGQRTFGAGCGFIAGGAAVQFESLPIHVMMPNCTRYTRDGVNEIEGLAPDIPIDWSAPDALSRLLSQVVRQEAAGNVSP